MLVWTVLGAVEQLDLDGFYGAYRANGPGSGGVRPGDDDLSCCCIRTRLGSGPRCRLSGRVGGDVAFKVITAMAVPDHSTVAEFRRRHEQAIGELFVSVLGLCGDAGLVRVGEIAVDETRMRANVSRDRNRGYESIVTEILAEAERVDREEDERLRGRALG